MSRSERFRIRVAETYDGLSPADEEAVEEVAQTLDLIDRLRAEVASGPLTEVRQGGKRVRPELVVGVRPHVSGQVRPDVSVSAW